MSEETWHLLHQWMWAMAAILWVMVLILKLVVHFA